MSDAKIKVSGWFQDELDALQTDPTFVAEDVILDVTEQIHVVMKEKDVSQAQLAERLGVSRSAVSQLLSGNQNVSIRRLVEVALALGMTITAPQLVPLQPAEVEAVQEGWTAETVRAKAYGASCLSRLWQDVAEKERLTVPVRSIAVMEHTDATTFRYAAEAHDHAHELQTAHDLAA